MRFPIAEPGPLRGEVTTVRGDGSCLYPKDPMLASPGRGLQCQHLDEPNLCGPVNGVQSAQRAEAAALVAATRAIAGQIDFVSDSRYVVDDFSKIQAGACVNEWCHADLWRQAAQHAAAG